MISAAHSGVNSATWALSSSKPYGPLVDVFDIVARLVDDDVHPGQEQGGIRPGLNGQPVVGFGRHLREARVDDDDFHAACPGIGKILHDRVAGVLADVAADQRETLQPVPVHGFVAADGRAVGQLGRFFAWAGAKR